MPQALIASQLFQADPIWLLEFAWAGRTFRFASEAVNILDEDSLSLSYEGALGAVDIDEEFDLFQDSPGLPSVSIELVFPEGVSVSTLIQQGHNLDGVTGELALHLLGDTYEERTLKLTGIISQPTYGADNEPVSFSLESLPFDDGATYPSARAVADVTTWGANVDSPADGQYYPTVFGAPIGPTAVPALLVQNTGGTNYLLIAGHHVQATTVSITDDTAGATATLDVINNFDDIGQDVAYVDLAASGSAPNAIAGNDYYSSWSGDGGGLVNYEGTGPLTGAGDIIRWLLERSTLQVDDGRTRAAATQLNQFHLAGYLDEAVTPFDYLQQVIELLPVSIVAGAKGVYPLPWRLDAIATDAVEALEAGPRFTRESMVEYADADIANEIRIEYSFDAEADEYRSNLAITGDATDGTDPAIFSTVYSRISQSRYGKRSKVITADLVYSTATAAAILKWQARAFGFPSRTVDYSVDLSLGWLERGDVVTLTDPELAFTSQVCMVRAMRWNDRALSLTLTIIEDPIRDAKL